MRAISYPRLGLTCQTRPSFKGLGCVGYGVRQQGMRGCWPPGGGSFGNGGGDDGEYFEAGDDDPRGFGWLAIFSVFAETPKKMEYYTIAANGVGEEEKKKEEEEKMYIKPPPRPRPESMSYGQFSSWLLLALLLSGGLFLWRRARRHRPTEEEETEDAALTQQPQEVSIPLEQAEPTAGASASTQEDASAHPATDKQAPSEQEDVQSSMAPDFSRELEQHDALFDIDRDVTVQTSPTAVEGFVHQPEDRPNTSNEPRAAAEAIVLPVDNAEGQGFKKSEEQNPELYNEDLEAKDAFFGVKGDLDGRDKDQGCQVSSIIEDEDDNKSIPEPLTGIDKENEEQDRSMTPPSHHDGSNQSSATQFNEEPEEKTDEEDFSFEKYIPDDQPTVEEDLGPPIKPTAVDFTKPAEIEKGTNEKWGKQTTDDKTSTLRYLLTNSDLLTEALKQMETTVPPEPEIVSKRSKKNKKKKNRSKNKKAGAAVEQF